MKWFQPVCISVGETNKDNYCQQIPFYPRVCLGRDGMLQPESIGLLGQSALAFYVCFFYYLYHAAEPFFNSYYTHGLGVGRGLQNKAAYFSHAFGKAGICGREQRLQQWANTAPY